jgi:hypothetical protein
MRFRSSHHHQPWRAFGPEPGLLSGRCFVFVSKKQIKWNRFG